MRRRRRGVGGKDEVGDVCLISTYIYTRFGQVYLLNANTHHIKAIWPFHRFRFTSDVPRHAAPAQPIHYTFHVRVYMCVCVPLSKRQYLCCRPTTVIFRTRKYE